MSPPCSEDGSVLLHDSRAFTASRPSGVCRNTTEFSDVKYHPESSKLFLTADNKGYVCLRDSRMAFDSGSRTVSGGIVTRVGSETTLHCDQGVCLTFRISVCDKDIAAFGADDGPAGSFQCCI